MIYNLETLRSELLNGLKKSDISTGRRDRWINEAQDQVVTEMDPYNLITEVTFTTTANQRTLYLDVEFNKVYSVIDEDSEINLMPLSEYQIEQADPSLNDTGTPYYYSLEGSSWVSAQPAAATAVTVVSDDNTDTADVRISGLVGGVEDTELLTLNGITPVVGVKLFTEIRQIVKSATTAGIVTASSGATTFVRIPSFLLAKTYQVVKLWPTPSAIFNFRFRGIRRARALVNVEDCPEVPESYQELVLIGALMRGSRDLQRMTYYDYLYKREWQPGIARLRSQMGNKRGRKAPIIEGSQAMYRWPFFREPVG